MVLLIFLQKACKSAPISQSVEGFFKKPYILFEFCVGDAGSLHMWKFTSSQNPRCSATNSKITPSWAKKQPFLWFLYIAGLAMDCRVSLRWHFWPIYQRTEQATKNLRPRMESSWRGKSRSAGTIFVWSFFHLCFQNTFPNKVQTKIISADLDSPRRTLLCRGLRSFRGVSVRW